MAVAATASLGRRLDALEGELRFSRLSVEDGLSQSSVMEIMQDRMGFLWFATEEGLSRFDGTHFVNHIARDRPGFLADSNIKALVEDEGGDLWVGTSRGLHRLELATGRFVPEGGTSAAGVDVRDVVRDAAGRIWMTGETNGLYALAPGGSPRVARRIAADALPDDAAITALAGGDGVLWAATGGGLVRLEAIAGGVRATTVLRDLGRVPVLATRPGAPLWIGRSEGELLRYDPRSGRVDRFPQAPRDVLALLPEADGTVWIGARDAGLSHLDPQTGAIAVHRNDPANPASISEDDVDALYEDRAGNLWIGTWNGGVDMVDPYAQSFRTLEHRVGVGDSLPDNDVIAMTETPDGRLWVGTRNAVLAVGDPRTGRGFAVVAPELAARGRVVALAHDGGQVFVSTRHGLATLDARSGREVPLSPALRRIHLDQRSIDGLAVGSRGELWMVSNRAVLVATREARATGALDADVPSTEVPFSTGVAAIRPSASARLWISSWTGDLMLAGLMAGPAPALTLRRFTAPAAKGPFDAGAYVSSLHEDAAGHLWVGTRRGLGEVDLVSGATRWFGRRGDLPSVDVGGVLEDEAGRIWFATNRGLTRLDPRTGAANYFGSREGAQGSGYAEGAFAAGSSGLFYFAGHGVTVFDPRDIQVDPNPPPIVLTGIEVLHRNVEPRWLDPRSPLERELHSVRSITLGPHASVFSIEMAALHFGDPRRNGFAYRLEGFDRDWIRTDAQRAVATYTRLAPGDYLFRARAVTKNGIWSARDATLAIHVLPPWWRAGPALAGWSLLALLVAIALSAEARRRTHVRLALLERETLRRASITDPLTGLYNRRFMMGYVEREVPRPLREYDSGRPPGDSGMLFLLVDLDHFKAINDRFSHTTGDRVLTAVAHTLRQQIRDSDLAVRWGGDEFLIVSRSFGREHARTAAERLRAAVESLAVGDEGPRCTVSIGWATFPFLLDDPRALTWEQTLELADRALHLTKRRRRNSWTGLVARPGARAASVLAFLAAGADAPPTDDVEVLTAAEAVPA